MKNILNALLILFVTLSIACGDDKKKDDPPVAVTGISLDKSSLQLLKDDAPTQLTATVEPANAANKNVTWDSSNDAVATVSSTGLVTPVGKGTVIISVETEDGAKEYECGVTVQMLVAYVANSSSDGTKALSIYSINPSTGVLSPIGVTSGGGKYSVAVSPNSKYLCASSSSAVFSFRIESSGLLTAINELSSGPDSFFITFDLTGKYVYAANSGSSNIRPYSINTDSGILTTNGSAITTGSYPSSIVYEPTGKFAYVSNYSSGTVTICSVDSTTGGLTNIGAISPGSGPISVAIEPTGKYLYVANLDGYTICTYSINNSTGALTAVGTPLPNGTDTYPYSIAIEPNGKYLYVSNTVSNTISSYTINQSSGELSVLGSPLQAGNRPRIIYADPTGKFVYCVNENDNNAKGYRINSATGELTSVGDPVETGNNPQSIVIIKN